MRGWPGTAAFSLEAGRFAAGEALRLYLRPEELRLLPPAEAGENALPGRVVDRRFLGPVTRLGVQVSEPVAVRPPAPTCCRGAESRDFRA